MRKFGYLRDGLFLASCALYATNRLLIKPLAPGGFFAWWFSDFLLIPCAAPVCLWIERRLGLRPHDCPPSVGEIFFLLLLWSLLFEFAAPLWLPRATGDWRDIAAYAAGAVVAFFWWNRPARDLPPGSVSG